MRARLNSNNIVIMARFCHVCVLVALVVVESAVLARKGLLCRDPDTGKFYAVNSTWASTTFCGNYTCKLKKLNQPETEYTPIRQLNISNVHNDTPDNSIENSNRTMSIEQILEPRIDPVIQKRTNDDLVSIEEKVIDKQIKNKENKDKKFNKIKQNTENLKIVNEVYRNENDKNRYLTKEEIKSITQVLHTVKKSDLDAIVDIYNLAQDIYNEVDKSTDDGFVDDTINTIKHVQFHKKSKNSYWYDPLITYKERDMIHQGTKVLPTTAKPVIPVKIKPTFFNGANGNQEYGKIPYYYPISSFQRSSSYQHRPTAVTAKKPCKAQQKLQDMQVEAQNLIKPSYLLPYPFAYVPPNNYSRYPSSIFYNIPNTWDYYNRQRQYRPYYQAFIAEVPTVPNAVLLNSHLQDINTEQKPVKEELLVKALKAKESLIPEWKTEQLSTQVLDEIRAKINTTKLLNAFPFRKKVNLEKVGKVININELARYRRSVNLDEVKEEKEVKGEPEEFEEYETYIEKTTCKTQVIPGFFRYGNLTQPYPHCCPQLIHHNDR